jgi:hypothetical protein
VTYCVRMYLCYTYRHAGVFLILSPENQLISYRSNLNLRRSVRCPPPNSIRVLGQDWGNVQQKMGKGANSPFHFRSNTGFTGIAYDHDPIPSSRGTIKPPQLLLRTPVLSACDLRRSHDSALQYHNTTTQKQYIKRTTEKKLQKTKKNA